MPQLSLKTVNDELARLGRAERLAKADNYFYFTGGAAKDWLETSVGVRTLNTLTLKEWIAEFRRLQALNEQIIGTVERGRKRRERRE